MSRVVAGRIVSSPVTDHCPPPKTAAIICQFNIHNSQKNP